MTTYSCLASSTLLPVVNLSHFCVHFKRTTIMSAAPGTATSSSLINGVSTAVTASSPMDSTVTTKANNDNITTTTTNSSGGGGDGATMEIATSSAAVNGNHAASVETTTEKAGHASTTAPAETAKHVLPDQSIVSLNAVSELSYVEYNPVPLPIISGLIL